MSCYQPGGIASGRDAYIGYSPYVRPTLIGGVKCVVVDERLRELERMAFDFVMNFARDNDLPGLRRLFNARCAASDHGRR